ncbi:MAG: HlyD family efflux transporter periplasmic adaptor subunit [Lachnospiraceae bacterium]|nr:HlyD family efflux transporter periplasmic adaptor subunit [Lachnospiraceae bacterium]
MNEQVGKKRDWIKNAAIVFLTIMLVLTFFSNTIMNYSLPEVSAQYVSSGTIQAKVRGSGTIEAGDPYSVKTDASKTILSVAVRNGDHVEKGDVLFYLEEGDSTELKQAQKTLDSLLDAYRQKALNADIDPEVTNKILNGQFTDFNTYYVKVQNLKKEIKELEDHIAVYEREIAKVQETRDEAAGEGSDSSKEKRQAYEACIAERQKAETALSAAFTAAGVSSVEEAATKLTAAETNLAATKKAVSDIKNGSAYQQAEVIRSGYESAIDKAKTDLEAATTAGDMTAQQAAQAAWNKALADLESHNANTTVYSELKTAEAAVEVAQKNQAVLAGVTNANAILATARANEEAAWKVYEAAGPDHSVAISQYDDVINKNKEYVNEQKEKVAEKQAELNDILTQMNQETSLSAELEAIAEQRELIKKLQGGSTESTIVAPISGKVDNIYLTAGNSTTPGNEVATIFPDGKGYTMEVTVTKEQAQRLSKGDVADIQNAWYYSDVTAVLQQIKTSKTDPANSKVLVFTVEGDVSDGQSLSISIGQKSANYDYIVPNSAIREDNNGKFILKVSQKSSPLGNRYYAERVDIEVLGSDDTQSAIRGALEGWEFVITTSTKPVEAGQLIRLPD